MIYLCVAGILCNRHSEMYKCRLSEDLGPDSLSQYFLLSGSSYSIRIMPWEGCFQAVLEPGSFPQCLHGHRNPIHTRHTKWRDFTLQDRCPTHSSCHSRLLWPTNILPLECSRKSVGVGLLFSNGLNLQEPWSLWVMTLSLCSTLLLLEQSVLTTEAQQTLEQWRNDRSPMLTDTCKPLILHSINQGSP